MADNEKKNSASLADLAPASSKKTASKKKTATKKKTTSKKASSKKVTAKKATTKKTVVAKKVSVKKKTTAKKKTATAVAGTTVASTASTASKPKTTSSELIPFWLQVLLWIAAMAILIFAYSLLEDTQKNEPANNAVVENTQTTTANSNNATMAGEQQALSDTKNQQTTKQLADSDATSATANNGSKLPNNGDNAVNNKPTQPAANNQNQANNNTNQLSNAQNNNPASGSNQFRAMPAMPMNAWRNGMPAVPQAPSFDAPKMIMPNPQSQQNNRQYRFIAPSMQMPAPPQYQMPNNAFNRNMPAIPMPYYAPGYQSK